MQSPSQNPDAELALEISRHSSSLKLVIVFLFSVEFANLMCRSGGKRLAFTIAPLASLKWKCNVSRCVLCEFQFEVRKMEKQLVIASSTGSIFSEGLDQLRVVNHIL